MSTKKNEFQNQVKQPSDCSKEELTEFYEMCREAKQVSLVGLENRIKNCPLLAFSRLDGVISGVAAIKRANDNYRTGVFEKAKSKAAEKLYLHEIGYVYTKPEFEGNGIGTKLTQILISKVEKSLFATTGNPRMKQILTRVGFKISGDPFPGTNNDTLELLINTYTNSES